MILSLGLQQYTGSEKVVQAVVTLKHFLAYSIESYEDVDRYNVDVKVSAYDMAHTYMPAWETLVKEGKALGIMCSYNAVNGLPTCGNPALNQTLREDWGFEGYMTSVRRVSAMFSLFGCFGPDVRGHA